MHIPREEPFGGPPRVDLTPLVDVVFLLVIFFVLAVPSIMLPMGIRVKLPVTSAATRLETSRLEVTITASDRIYVGARQVSLAELERTAAGAASAHIRGDVACSLGRVVAAYGALKRAGVKSISVATGIEVEERE